MGKIEASGLFKHRVRIGRHYNLRVAPEPKDSLLLSTHPSPKGLGGIVSTVGVPRPVRRYRQGRLPKRTSETVRRQRGYVIGRDRRERRDSTPRQCESIAQFWIGTPSGSKSKRLLKLCEKVLVTGHFIFYQSAFNRGFVSD